MNYLNKTLDFLHQQGWSYGMIRYMDTVTRKEVHQIDAHQGYRWEVGRGRTWTEAVRDLVKKIYDIP
jgi:phospholipase/lecithinase/hemolysin